MNVDVLLEKEKNNDKTDDEFSNKIKVIACE